jgi:hypothetical protein
MRQSHAIFLVLFPVVGLFQVLEVTLPREGD